MLYKVQLAPFGLGKMSKKVPDPILIWAFPVWPGATLIANEIDAICVLGVATLQPRFVIVSKEFTVLAPDTVFVPYGVTAVEGPNGLPLNLSLIVNLGKKKLTHPYFCPCRTCDWEINAVQPLGKVDFIVKNDVLEPKHQPNNCTHDTSNLSIVAKRRRATRTRRTN